jgi:hypothetical protein
MGARSNGSRDGPAISHADAVLVLGEGECMLGTVPDDVDAQEPLGSTQVTKLEVLT